MYSRDEAVLDRLATRPRHGVLKWDVGRWKAWCSVSWIGPWPSLRGVVKPGRHAGKGAAITHKVRVQLPRLPFLGAKGC